MNSNYLNKAERIGKDIFNYCFSGGVPLLYFNSIPNVGDLVSGYLVSKISGKEFYKAQTRMLPHLSAVGSTLGVVSKMTHVWGSGLIDGKLSNRGLLRNKVHALRGHNTLNEINKYFSTSIKCPLGDPAILMSEYYDREVPKKYQFGLVPHFDEYEKVLALIGNCFSEIKVIDVRQDPVSFVDELRSCEIIASSSLHGLILADSYELPSVWFSASEKLIGGTWKFLDYFTCTDSILTSPVPIVGEGELQLLLRKMKEKGRVRKYKYSKKELLVSYPDIF